MLTFYYKALGLELVKIILLTIPYVLSSSTTGADGSARALLEKTDIIASTPHALEALVDPYPGEGDDKPRESPSVRGPKNRRITPSADRDLQVIALLQKQLQDESTREWPVACIPRPWKMPAKEDGSDPLATATKHAFPKLVVPDPVPQPAQPMFPELYFSVYADQDIEVGYDLFSHN